jgi:RNA polymerase sigma-70 factor (ECF subfamily)
MDALERADLDAVLALLTEDAAWSMPPDRIWFRGRDAITRFLTEWAFKPRWRHVPTRASGQAAVGCYTWDSAAGAWVAEALDVLTLRGDRIADVTAFRSPEVFRRLGLAVELGD